MSGWQRLFVDRVDVVLRPDGRELEAQEPIPNDDGCDGDGGAGSEPRSSSASSVSSASPSSSSLFRRSSARVGSSFPTTSSPRTLPVPRRESEPFRRSRHPSQSSFCQFHFNHDLVKIIFAFLGDGRSYQQAATLALVCKDWYSCVRYHSSFWTAIEAQNFSLSRAHVEDSLVEELLGRYSDMVQNVTIRDCLYLTERSVFGVAAHCPNLVSLDVESVGSYLLRDLTSAIVEVVDRCQALQHLNLSSCPNLHGAAVRYLGSHATQLQTLRLRHNASLSCDDLWHLRHCSELRVLDITGCHLVRDRTVIAICNAAGPHLRTLGMASCPLLTDGAVKAAFERCPNLEALDFCQLPLVTKHAFVPLVARRNRSIGRHRTPRGAGVGTGTCLLYTSPSPRDRG